MIKVSVMYPNSPGARFDHEYYRDKHMPLLKARMGSSCKYYTVDKGLTGGAPGAPATYVAMCHIFCDSVEAFHQGTARAAEVVPLRSEVSQLRLRLGEPFQPGTLRITARDASGAVLPHVPLAVEVSGPPNACARERLAQLVDEDGSMVPTRPASVRLRVPTICAGAGADTLVRAEISQE